MGDMVIAAYRAKPGKLDELIALTREHVPILRGLGFATERPCLAMQAEGGVIVEVFEWADGAIEKAHQHPEVHALWARFGAVCDYVPLEQLPEAKKMFAEFKPLAL